MLFIWIVVGLLLAYLAYGLLVKTDYRRVFAGDFAQDQIKDGYLRPQEVIDPDEDVLAARVSAAVAHDTSRRKEFAGRDDPMFHEPHWGHTSALLQGTLTIDGVENLPKAFRTGLFKQNCSYPVVARSGVAKDPDLGFAINRLALKIKYPEMVPNVYAPSGTAEELDLLLVAGEPAANGASHTFFARDGRQLDMATSLKPPSIKTLKILANWRNVRMLAGVFGTVKRSMQPMRRAPSSAAGWAGKPYFSLGPFALGNGAMKFNLTPKQEDPVADTDPLKSDIAAVNKDNMEAWMAKGEAAEFLLGVQLATPDCIPEPGPDDPPKSVMAAEYCDIQWDEGRSPYIAVGTLRLTARETINDQSLWGSLQFNAWNTLPEMRPLGQLFRLRKHVHAAHSDVRVSHLYGGKPGELVGRCPFSG